MGTTASIELLLKPHKAESWLGHRLDDFLSRLLDILASVLGLFFLSPFFVLIAIFIRRDSPGPVFFRGSRVGKNGKEFKILKFRTMFEAPASYAGPCITGQGDGRVTPFGHWLRDTKLNELPQLWNVLTGEMSLVGPRPEDPTIAAGWPAALRSEVLSVRPGMTSPASIVYRDEEGLLPSANLVEGYLKDVLPSKLRLDLLYVRRCSVLNDLDIIFLTFIALLPQLRKKAFPESVLYNGLLSRVFHRYLNWFFIDWLVAGLEVSLTFVYWRLRTPLNLGMWHAAAVALLIALVFSVTNALLRLNVIAWRSARADAALDLGFSAACTTLVLYLVNFSNLAPFHLPPYLIDLLGVSSFFGFVAVRYRERILTAVASRWLRLRRAAPHIGERVLIIGAGEMGALASWLVKRSDFARAFSVVGFVDDDPLKTGLSIDGSPVLGSAADLHALIQKYDIGLALFAISNITGEQRSRILSICGRESVRVAFFPNIIDTINAGLKVEGPSPAARPVDGADVSGLLDELDALLDRGDLTLARQRIHETQRQYAFSEAD